MSDKEEIPSPIGNFVEEKRFPIDEKTYSLDEKTGEVEIIITDADKREEIIGRFEEIAAQEKLEISDRDIHFIVDRIAERSLEDAIKILEDAIEYHAHDPNFNLQTYEKIQELVKGPELFDGSQTDYEFEVKLEAALIDDWSPYPEVRAVTQMNDDPEEHCETFRVYVIGLVLAVAGVILNTFFFNRFPSITLSSMCLQMIMAPWGQLWGQYLPDWGFVFRGTRYSLNPGPWTYKEQMLCTLMVSVSCGAPYSAYVITSQNNEYFYGFKWAGIGFQILLTLTSSFMGFGIAGIMRTFLVYPVHAMWFGVLPNLALNRALIKVEPKQNIEIREERTVKILGNSNFAQKYRNHLGRMLFFWRSDENINGWVITRNAFFWLFVLISFLWYWVPDFLFAALSYFNWMTWISPQNVTLAAITGSIGGLAFNPISTFDWSVLNNGGLVTPFFASSNAMIGQLIGFFAIVIIYFNNIKWTSHIPINANGLYDNTGQAYNVSRVLNAHNLLDEQAYQDYSPPFYSAGNLVTYGSFFMLYPCMIVYSLLHYRKPLAVSLKQFWRALRNPKESLNQYNDPFCRAMRKHKEVPEWWFMAILVLSMALSIVLVEVFPDTNTPVWSLFFGLGVNIVFIVPFGLLYAITNTSWDVNVIVELIMGYAKPGNPNALMIVKCYATNFLSQTENYVTNQKQAHYARVPPRSLFRVQMLSVLITTFAACGILNWQLSGAIQNFCDPQNTQKFTCADTRTFFSASVLWGTIGPKRVFETIYPAMKYCFLIGALLPIPFYILERFTKIGRYCNVLVMIAGALTWAPYNWMYTLPNYYFAIAFNYIIKRRYNSWWQKYNYLLYVALTAGVSWSAFIMFFATEYNHIAGVNWWGNWVSYGGPNYDGVDLMGPVISPMAPGATFGPEAGSWK